MSTLAKLSVKTDQRQALCLLNECSWFVMSYQFDGFVSYNRKDVHAVDVLVSRLTQEAGLSVWIDHALTPGDSWRTEIEKVMGFSKAVIIAWGAGGLGAVQRQERDLAYAFRDAQPDFRVVYVFLPGAASPQGTWANVDTWVRFEYGLDEIQPFIHLAAVLKG